MNTANVLQQLNPYPYVALAEVVNFLHPILRQVGEAQSIRDSHRFSARKIPEEVGHLAQESFLLNRAMRNPRLVLKRKAHKEQLFKTVEKLSYANNRAVFYKSVGGLLDEISTQEVLRFRKHFYELARFTGASEEQIASKADLEVREWTLHYSVWSEKRLADAINTPFQDEVAPVIVKLVDPDLKRSLENLDNSSLELLIDEVAEDTFRISYHFPRQLKDAHYDLTGNQILPESSYIQLVEASKRTLAANSVHS